MSFQYSEVDLDKLESVRLVDGEISPQSGDTSKTTDSLTSEQKRKSQLVDFLENEFDRFHSMIDELIDCYNSLARRNAVSETVGVPDYLNCSNCSHLAESENGNPICMATEVQEDGETLRKVIPDTGSLPSFCSRDMRHVDFPEDRINEVDDDLVSTLEKGYEQYLEDRDYLVELDEYVSRELIRYVRGLFDARDFDDYRGSAIRVAWVLHLDDVLEEDWHPQRAEAYLRAMDSPFQAETLPGQGGDKFEQDVREYLKSLNFLMLDRVFELDGVSANYKEMDIHTKLPWGDRAIFEVFSSGGIHKDRQVAQYAELLKRAEDVESVQILFKEGYGSNLTIEKQLLFDLLSSNTHTTPDIELPGDSWSGSRGDDFEYLGDAEDLSYSQFEPEFEPLRASQQVESQLLAQLRGLGYDPVLPVYNHKDDYLFCGPTIVLGDGSDKLSLTLFANRELEWKGYGDESTRNKRRFERGSGTIGYNWQVRTPSHWRRNITESVEMPVAVVEISDQNPSEITPPVFDRLLRE